MLYIEALNMISLLPAYSAPETLLVGQGLPCHGVPIQRQAAQSVLSSLNRNAWSEGLYVSENDVDKLIRYQNAEGSYKHDFTEEQFFTWLKDIEENTAICEMENKKVGKGIFVPPGKVLPKGTFIISSGVIKLNPTVEELETKVHCSALQDLNVRDKKIIGLIDPEKMGGILDLINHAPTLEELANFNFKSVAIKEQVAVTNLKSVIKFYNGYSIMGVESVNDIEGQECGAQLLWSYAHACEYIENGQTYLQPKILLLFDGRNKHNGEVLDINQYSLKEINIYIDTDEMMVRKVATLTRWEIMESRPETSLTMAVEDPYSSNQSEAIRSPILYGYLQSYLKKNPMADRVIIKVPG
jgi:hypothetical protein